MVYGVPVVVIVPAYEEERILPRVLARMPASVDRVIVVDDASRDNTGEVARRFGGRVELLQHVRNMGVGAAICTGYARALATTTEARAAFVVMAGDDQMCGDDLPALVEPIASGCADYVKGNRFAWPGAARAMPPLRYAGGQVLSWVTSVAVGRRVHDTQCGFTAIARQACEKLDLDGLWPRYGYPNDLLGQLSARGARIVERPVRPVYADEASRLRARHVPRILWLIARAGVRNHFGGLGESSAKGLAR
jgi:glycosyltransferase involved in cell wall biosynthesis